MHDGERGEEGIRQRIPERGRRLQRPCQWSEEEGRGVKRREKKVKVGSMGAACARVRRKMVGSHCSSFMCTQALGYPHHDH
jgi:hypothetical protein